MSGEEELQEALAEALDDTATGLWMGEHGPGWGQVIANALLPVVLRYGRETAAEELRAAADEVYLNVNGRHSLRERADALAAQDPT